MTTPAPAGVDVGFSQRYAHSTPFHAASTICKNLPVALIVVSVDKGALLSPRRTE
jgi:hypothetical protein